MNGPSASGPASRDPSVTKAASPAWPVDRALLRPIAKAVSAAGISLGDVVASLRPDGRGAKGQGGFPDIDLADYFLLLERLAHLTGDETFRLSKRPLMSGALHYVLSQVATSEVFEDALRCIAKSYNFLHGGTYNHVMVRDNTLIYIIDNSRFPYTLELGQAQSDSLMECIMVLMHFVFILTTSDRLDDVLLRVWTKRKRKPARGGTDQLGIWRVPIRWKAPTFALVYDISAAALPVTLRQDSLPAPHAVYGLIGDMIRRRQSRKTAPASYAAQVAVLLDRRLRSAEQVALTLGASERTLRRRLHQEGTSFRETCQAVLNSRARSLLANDHLVDEVAEELGYSDGRSFRRAFLRWNQATPTSFRRTVLSHKSL